MRVIAGTAKGRSLKGPPGMGTRPMTDRLKVSLFDTLMPYGIIGARVVDLYAGSGSLGIELLSRGAEWVDFVEQNAGVCRIIEDNLRTTALNDRARVYKMPVRRFLGLKGVVPTIGEGSEGIQRADKPLDSTAEYDIIILDPPYADQEIEQNLDLIANSTLLAQDGILVIGHANRVKLADQYGGGRLCRVKQREMGGSAFSIYEANLVAQA